MNKEANRREHPLIMDFLLGSKWGIKPDVLEMIVGIVKNGGDQKLAAAIRGERLSNTRNVTLLPSGIGVLPVFGPLVPRASIFDEVSGATSVRGLSQDLAEMMENPSVKTIILDVDSPGGVVTGISDFSDMIREAGEDKRVVAYVSGMGASAAYWVLSAAQEIVVNPTSELGSIGIVHLYVDDTKRQEIEGFQEIEIVSSKSPKKRLSPTTAEGKQEVQSIVDDIYDVMVSAIAQNRGLSVDDVNSGFGEGGMFIAQKAVARKMADAVMSFDELIRRESATNETNRIGVSFMGANNQQPTNVPEEPKTVASLQEKYPALCQEIREASYKDGIRAENERQMGLDSVPSAGHEDLVKQARKDTSVTKEALAFSILEEKNKKASAVAGAVKADGENLADLSKNIGSAPPTGGDEEREKTLSAKMAAGANSRRK